MEMLVTWLSRWSNDLIDLEHVYSSGVLKLQFKYMYLLSDLENTEIKESQAVQIFRKRQQWQLTYFFVPHVIYYVQ